MPALADYIDLRVAVVEFTKRPDMADLLDRFTLLAEDEINRKLHHRKQITLAVLTFTDGVADLPADYQEMLRVYNATGCEMRQTPLPRDSNGFVSYDDYSIDGDQIRISGFTGDREITYYAKVPTLTTSMTTTNWLLEEYPDVYLYGVSAQMLVSTDEERFGLAARLFERAKKELKIDDNRARYGQGVVTLSGATP